MGERAAKGARWGVVAGGQRGARSGRLSLCEGREYQRRAWRGRLGLPLGEPTRGSRSGQRRS